MVHPDKAKNTLSIKAKLTLIGVLFIINTLAIEGISTYSELQVSGAMAEATQRQEQLAMLTEMEVRLTEFILAGMDAIIDRESGAIAADLQEEMAKASKFWREKLPVLQEMADTEQEKVLSRQVKELFPTLEQTILTDLSRLVTGRSDKTSFDEIDDRIDTIGGKIDQDLMTYTASVKKEQLEASQTMQREIDTAALIRRGLAAAMLLLLGGSLVLIARSILKPILAATALVQDVAQGEGDLTKRLLAGGDEIGTLSTHFNTFMEKLHGIIHQVRDNLSILNTTAVNLATLSETLAAGSEEATSRASTVATAAEEMSSNMSAVAAASEQSAVNVNMVASATEEMSGTVTEIAGNTARARKIAEEAVDKTDKAAQRVDALGNAAKDISKVTEVITEISEQTNLLALNATIEAARAGEAGKGFAVVANEIKELAKQTAGATLEIRQKIEAIQSSTDLTINEIKEISDIINKVSDIVSTIAGAVEEQTSATNEIAGNVAQAAQGINEVNENVSQSSTVSGEISREISGVSHVAEQLRESGAKVKTQSTDLTALARQLADIVNQFKLAS